MTTLGRVCLVLSLLVVGVWAVGGMHLATRTRVPVEVQSTDDFGDTVTNVEWRPTFELGLELTVPAAGGLFGIGALALVRGRRRRLQNSSSAPKLRPMR